MASNKVTLVNLKVADLKRELESREEDTTGKKYVLQQKLRKILIQEGEDPDVYLFNTAGDINSAFKDLKDKMLENSKNLRDEMLENSDDLEFRMMEKFEKILEVIELRVSVLSKEVNKKLQYMEQNIMDSSAETERKLFDEVERRITSLNLQQHDRPLVSDVVIQNDKNNERGTVSKINMKPPQFDGKTSWPSYFLQFEAAARANGWSSEDKVTALILALRGDATNVLQTLSPTDQGDYEKLVKRLETRYGQPRLEYVYHCQLKNRYQKSGETLQEFETDIARLVRLAYSDTPENVLERLAVQAFVDGLLDIETKQALILARPTKLVGALARALEVEAAKLCSRSQAKLQVMDDPADSQFNGEKEAKIRRVVNEVLSQKKHIQCWNCGKFGHMQNGCSEKMMAPAATLSSLSGKLNTVNELGRSSAYTQQAPLPKTVQIASLQHKSNGVFMDEVLDRKVRPFDAINRNSDALVRKPCPEDREHCHRAEEKDIPIRRITVVDDHWQFQEIQDDQEKDLELKSIIDWKREDRRPTWQAISRYSPNVKSYWSQWKSLVISDGILKRVLETSDGREERMQLVIPRNRVSEVLEEVHNGTTGGHLGTTRTLSKIRERFYWVNCRKDVEDWCKKCTVCAASNGPQRRAKGPFAGNHTELDNAQVREITPPENRPPEPTFEEFMTMHSSGRATRYGVTREEQRDLFDVPHEYSLAHCVAQDLRMSRGLAATFKERFQKTDELIRQNPQIGQVLQIEDEQSTFRRGIFYLVTKQQFHQKPSYRAVWDALSELREILRIQDITKLAIPKLACGLDSLNWRVVRSMIEVLFRSTDIEILVCCHKPSRSMGKTVDCYFYQTSHCRNGPACRYLHRSVEDTFRDERSLRRGQCDGLPSPAWPLQLRH